MRLAPALLAGALALPAPAVALDVGGHAAVRGWFFGVDGTIEEDTDLDALDFDDLKGQPEFFGGLRLGRRHHLSFAYLLVRRSEEGTAEGQVLGIVPVQDQVAIDLDVDYVRGGYGFSVLARDWIELRPFLEVAYLREETDIRNQSTGDRNRQEDSAVFPLPGAEVVVGAAFPVRLRGRAAGIGTGDGHLIDVEGGVEAGWRWVFGGLGYRYVDFRVEDSGGEVADVSADGLYLQGGLRF